MSDPYPKPGDRVRCTDDRCADLVKMGRLKEGADYTVMTADDGWSIYLRELPALQFNARRFEVI